MNSLIVLFAALSIASVSCHYYGGDKPYRYYGGIESQGFAGAGFTGSQATVAGASVGPYNVNGPSFGPSEVSGPQYGPSRVSGPTNGPASIVGPRVAAASVTGPVNEGAVLTAPVFGGVRFVNRGGWADGGSGEDWNDHGYEH